MSRQSGSLRRTLMLVAIVALLLTPISVFAQGEGPLNADQFRNPMAFKLSNSAAHAALQAADVAPQDATLEVIAEGLNNPRGLDLSIKNQLYVAEAGLAGDNCIEIDPENDPGFMVCTGDTGSVTRINLNTGAYSRVSTGFPSLGTGYGPEETTLGVTGLTDISTQGGNFGIIGLGAPPEVRDIFGLGQFGYEVKNPQSPRWRWTVDVAQHEADENPDGSFIDSNPYSVVALNGVESAVVDAGGNSLLKVNAATQSVSTIAVFPRELVPVDPVIQDLFGLPPNWEAEAVPNSVVVGPDGAFYVGQLLGFPFTPGFSDVFRVAMDGSVSVYEGGFTSIIDIAFDADGNLYVLEIAKNGLFGCEFFGDCAGALIKVDGVTGDRTEIASDGLIAPGGVVVAADGSIYVSNYSIFPGMGQVVKITP